MNVYLYAALRRISGITDKTYTSQRTQCRRHGRPNHHSCNWCARKIHSKCICVGNDQWAPEPVSCFWWRPLHRSDDHRWQICLIASASFTLNDLALPPVATDEVQAFKQETSRGVVSDKD